MTRNYRNPRGLPYSPPDADSYTYVDGRGFAPTPPVITERRLLQWCANGIGFSILFYIIFSFTLPGVVLGIFQIFNPYMHIYSDGTVLSPLIMEIVELISGNLSLLLPFLLTAKAAGEKRYGYQLLTSDTQRTIYKDIAEGITIYKFFPRNIRSVCIITQIYHTSIFLIYKSECTICSKFKYFII